jgi:flagellar basal-body rod protein FlgF
MGFALRNIEIIFWRSIMQSGLYTSASGMIVSQHYLDLVANNLANLNTPGFKREIPFVSELESAQNELNSKDDLNRARNAAVKVGGGVIDLSSGVLKQTGNKLDLAIEGNGFFAVLTEDGLRYTKAGNFTLSRDNILQTMSGNPVLNDKLTEIPISGNNVKFENDGTVVVDDEVVDRLAVYDIPADKLVREGENLFSTIDPTNEPQMANDYKVYAGYLEMSNVNSIDEMVRLIELTRAAQFYQKMITAVMDTTTQKVINEVGVLR